MSSISEPISKDPSSPSPVFLEGRAIEKAGVDAGHLTKAPRYVFVDLLRGFALVVMIETHVVNAYFPEILRRGSESFFWLAFVNGLVAPSFLFATGFSLVLQSDRQWDRWLRFRLPFWRQMRRLGFIGLVAYFTHLQGFRLSRYLANRNDYGLWSETLKVDILQCIVASLLVVLVLILVLRKRKLLPWGLGLLAILMALATPWIWAQDFRGRVPLSVALFLNPHGISLFPVFPWMCFVLAGSYASHFFLKSVNRQKIARYMKVTAWLGILMIACGLLLRNAPYTLPGYANLYTTSPLYVMIRLGCVLLFCAFLYTLEANERWIPRPVQLAGQESLLVYGVHLWVIFALLRGRLLGPILGRQSGYIGCFLISTAIILLMLYLAKHYHALKKTYPSRTRLTQGVVVCAMIVVFLLS
jgi:uncharacterized membrane protein